MVEPDVAHRHDVHVDLEQRVPHPVTARAQDALELTIAEQQTALVLTNLETTQHHQCAPPFREKPPGRSAGRHASGVERDLRSRRLRRSAGTLPWPDGRHDAVPESGVWAGPVSARFRTPSRACRPRPVRAPSAGGRITASAPETTRRTNDVRVGAGFEPATAEFSARCSTTELAIGGMAGFEPAIAVLTPPSLEPVRGTGVADHEVRRRTPPARGLSAVSRPDDSRGDGWMRVARQLPLRADHVIRGVRSRPALRLDESLESLADHETDELLDVGAALVGDHGVGVDVDGQVAASRSGRTAGRGPRTSRPPSAAARAGSVIRGTTSRR